MASSCRQMVCNQWLGWHFHPFFLDLDHCSNPFLQPLWSTASSHWCRVRHWQLGQICCPCFWTRHDKRSCQARLHPSNRGRWFHVWILFVRWAYHYNNKWILTYMEAGIVSKMRTPAITHWFSKKWLFGFFILEKWLASQNIFLIKSELPLQHIPFLFSINQHRYNHNRFSKILRAFC